MTQPTLRRPRRLVLLAALLAALGFAASGCTVTGAAVGAAATAGTVAAQERSVGDAIDDAAVELEINRLYLQESPALFANVSVDCVEGRVLLTGSVAKPEDRIEAVKLAWQADGVAEVINEIQVNDRTGFLDYSRDVWISTQLRTELLFDKDVAAINYSVDTVNGTVYLMGIAQNRAELDRVINHARDIAYVRQVVSYVRLKNEPKTSAEK